MQKEIFFETIIIGGGPSGSACGIELLKKNKNCCIIDKDIFPREKVCGGLLPEKTIKLLAEIMSDKTLTDINQAIKIDTSRSIGFYLNYKLMASSHTETTFTICDRKVLDNYLLDYYKEHGGKTYEGTFIEKIDFKNKKVYTKDKKIFSYQYLVAADGVNSYVRKALNKKQLKKVFFIEYDIHKKDFKYKNELSFYDQNGKQLGWIFPKGDFYNVGLGFAKKEKNAVEITEKFLKELGVKNINDYQRKGALLPNTTIVKPTDKHDVLFVGDAGSFSEPLTGEGIYQALYSGKMAALSIINNKKVLKEYIRSTKTLRQSKKIMGIAQFFIVKLDKHAVNRLKKRPHTITRMVDGHIGKRSLKYTSIFAFIKSYKNYSK